MAGMYAVSPAPSGFEADIELATGTVFSPIEFDEGGAPIAGHDGTPLEQRCAGVLINSTYVVTSYKCLGDPYGTKRFELYSTAAWLNWIPSTILTTAGQWFGFTHPTLGPADGYFTESFNCTVVRACTDWNPVDDFNCNTGFHARAVLLECDGYPGHTYGHAELAQNDYINAPVYSAYAKEIYDVSGTAGDGLWYDHYILGSQEPTENIAFYGDGRHQMIPVHSVPRLLETENTKYDVPYRDSDPDIHYTDLLGCGSHNAPIFQRLPTGEYELHGPASFFLGQRSWDFNQFCPIPALYPEKYYWDPMSSYPSVEQLHKFIGEYEDDCDYILNRGLYTFIRCIRGILGRDWIEWVPPYQVLLESPRGTVLESILPRHEPWMQFNSPQPLEVGLGLEPGRAYRVSADLLAPLDSEGSMSIALTDGTVVAEAFSSGDVDDRLQIAYGTFVADESGSLTLTASAGASIGQVALAPVGESNGLDLAMERYGVGSVDEDGARPPTFGGTGPGQFAVVLAPGERVAFTREAIPLDEDISVILSISRGEGLVRVGMLDLSGEQSSTTVFVEPGSVELSLEAMPEPIAVFVESVEATEAIEVDALMVD